MNQHPPAAQWKINDGLDSCLRTIAGAAPGRELLVFRQQLDHALEFADRDEELIGRFREAGATKGLDVVDLDAEIAEAIDTAEENARTSRITGARPTNGHAASELQNHPVLAERLGADFLEPEALPTYVDQLGPEPPPIEPEPGQYCSSLSNQAAPPAPLVYAIPPLTVAEWLARDLPDPDCLLGHWLSTTSRVLLVAPTGIGKTNFAVALGFRIEGGRDFLHWAGIGKPRRVLFIDGEMSRRLLKRRLREEGERAGSVPTMFYALSREDLENFAPLNTPEGQAALLSFIEAIGGVDLVIFDNIMSLTVGDMKETGAWAQTLPLVAALTRLSIGQIWIHHTGHDESRSYGDKTKEWQMDTVIHLETLQRDDTDVSFTLQFRKARERTPETRHDFQDIKIALVDDRWTFEAADGSRAGHVPPVTMKFYTALQNVLAGDQAEPFHGRRAATSKAWQDECALLGLIDREAKPASARAMFSTHRRNLVGANLIACQDDLAWVL